MGTLHHLGGLTNSGSRGPDGSLDSPSSVLFSPLLYISLFLVKATGFVVLSRFVVKPTLILYHKTCTFRFPENFSLNLTLRLPYLCGLHHDYLRVNGRKPYHHE